MNVALIRRSLESLHARSNEGANVPGRILWTDRDYKKREIVYLIETGSDAGAHVPELVELDNAGPDK